MEREEIAERWRRPIKIFAVSEDEESVVRFSEREGWHRGVRWITDEEGLSRMKSGQVCFHCTEPQPPPAPNPPPEVCSLCGYGIRSQQQRDLDREFRGTEKIGASTSISDELARLDHLSDKKRWEKHPTLGIVVPRGTG